MFDVKRMVHRESLVSVDYGKNQRLGVMPKYDKYESRIKWFSIQDYFCFHHLNAWKEIFGDRECTVVVVGSCMSPRTVCLMRMMMWSSSVS